MKKITLNKKQIGAIAIAAGMAFMPAMGVTFAQSQLSPEKEMISAQDKKDESSEYKLSQAVVDKVETQGNITTVYATENNQPVVYKISDALVYRQSTMQKAEASQIKEGDKLQTYFDKNAPMILIYPPQYPVKVAVIMDGEGSVKVAKFDKDILSIENNMIDALKLNISEDTILESADKKTYTKEELAGKNLLVFYSVTTRSIPPQTNPEKIVVLPDLQQMGEGNNDGADNNVQQDKEINEIIAGNSYFNGTMQMITVAKIAQILGYEVKWNASEKTVELRKDENLIELVVMNNVYRVNGKEIKMILPMEIKEGRTYAELSILDLLK